MLVSIARRRSLEGASWRELLVVLVEILLKLRQLVVERVVQLYPEL